MSHPLDPGPAYSPRTRTQRQQDEAERIRDDFLAKIKFEATVFATHLALRAKESGIDLDRKEINGFRQYCRDITDVGVIAEVVCDTVQQFFDIPDPDLIEDALLARLNGDAK